MSPTVFVAEKSPKPGLGLPVGIVFAYRGEI